MEILHDLALQIHLDIRDIESRDGRMALFEVIANHPNRRAAGKISDQRDDEILAVHFPDVLVGRFG